MTSEEVKEMLDTLREIGRKTKIQVNYSGDGVNDFVVFLQHMEVKTPKEITSIMKEA